MEGIWVFTKHKKQMLNKVVAISSDLWLKYCRMPILMVCETINQKLYAENCPNTVLKLLI